MGTRPLPGLMPTRLLRRRSSRRSKRPLKALLCRSFRRWPVLEAWEACLEEWEAWAECQGVCLTWEAWVALLLRMTPLVDPPLRKSIKRLRDMQLADLSEVIIH